MPPGTPCQCESMSVFLRWRLDLRRLGSKSVIVTGKAAEHLSAGDLAAVGIMLGSFGGAKS